MSWHPSKISKIEAGRQTPSEHDIEAWVNGYMLHGLTAALRSLDSHYLEYRRAMRPGIRKIQRELANIEDEAAVIRNFETALVPGLLQTPEYARSRLSLAASYGATDLEEAVATRMERQQVLYARGKRLHFVVTEPVLRYRGCPIETLLNQLDRLVTLTTLQTVRFGVIPFGEEFRSPPLHGFFVYDDRLVRIETLSARLSLEEPQEVEAYLRYFSEFAERAVYGADARALITRVMGELAEELPHENESDEDAP